MVGGTLIFVSTRELIQIQSVFLCYPVSLFCRASHVWPILFFARLLRRPPLPPCFVLFSILLPGGTLSAFATIPIDIVVANIQKASSAGKKVSVMEIFQAQVQ